MIKLYNIINLLNKEESRNLKIFLNRTNSNNSRKDIALFDYAKKNKEDLDEEKLLTQLYGNSADKNSFYRLKNRLLNDINKSLLLLNYDKNDYISTINLISLAQLFINKKNYSVAYEYLNQAESKAIKYEFFKLLDLTYSEIISLSHNSADFNPTEYIEKRKKNQLNLKVLNEVDDLLATLIYRIKTSQNYSTQNKQFTQLLKKTIDEFIDNEEIKKSTKLQFKVYHSLSRILLQEKDYIALEDYLKITYNDFLKRGLFNKKTHATKLQMLTYLINSLYKNDKLKESLKMTEDLYQAMHEYDKLLFNDYLFYYYNSLVINYQRTDKEKAIAVLQEAKLKKEIQELPFFITFIYLNLGVFFFETNNFKNAKKNLAQLKLSDSFINMDKVFKFKVNIFELLNSYEFGDIDLFDYQLKNIRTHFKDLLNSEEHKREHLFLEILSKMDNDASMTLAKKFLTQYSDGSLSGNDIVNYNDWLETKIKKEQP